MSHDLIKKTFAKGLSDRRELLFARISAAVAIIIAGYFGIYPFGFVAQVVAFAFGLAAASLFPAILLGIFDKRMNKPGAIAGMVSGLLFTLVLHRLLQVHGTTDEYCGALVVRHIT